MTYNVNGVLLEPGMKNEVIEISEEAIKQLAIDGFKNNVIKDDNGKPIGKLNSVTLEDNNLKMNGSIFCDYEFQPSFSYDPICSKCGSKFTECDHWFDEAHIIAKNIEITDVSLVRKVNEND